jgi:hypothetical protein
LRYTPAPVFSVPFRVVPRYFPSKYLSRERPSSCEPSAYINLAGANLVAFCNSCDVTRERLSLAPMPPHCSEEFKGSDPFVFPGNRQLSGALWCQGPEWRPVRARSQALIPMGDWCGSGRSRHDRRRQPGCG